jgi:plastocyanin
VTADDGSFTSPKTGLTSGKTYSHTFGQAGTYHYHCFIHPQMLGTVVVQ